MLFRQICRTLGVAGIILMLALGMSGCGHKSQASSAKHPSTAASMNHKASSTAASTGRKAGSCAKGVSGTINGKTKCLAAGEQCQHKAAKDYKKYGFTCASKGKEYILEKQK